MKTKYIFLLLFIIPLLSFSAHKYYLSLTQIKYKSEEKAVQIIINVFMDDIELALNKDYDGDLVYFYLEIADIKQFKTIEVENNILIEHFPQQQNLTKCKLGEKHKSVLLTKEDNSAKFTY